MGFLLSGATHERVSIRITNGNYVGCTSLRDCHSHDRGTVMSHPVLLGSTLTDDEFKQLYYLASSPKYSIRENACFCVQPDLSIGCSHSYFFDEVSDR